MPGSKVMYSFTFGLNKEEIDDSSLKEVPKDEKHIAKKCFSHVCMPLVNGVVLTTST
jgi:hypothetical protein